MGKQRYQQLPPKLFFFNIFLLEQFFESFLFGSSEQRSSSSDTGTHSSAYNTIAIQFAPKHLGLILVSFADVYLFIRNYLF